MLYGLDLFSGIGGAALALRNYVRPIAYCEIDPYCQTVLLSRQAAGDIPVAPIWDDVSTLARHHITVAVDIVTGGFPCQDISVAGSGAGLEGKRSGLFFQVCRLIDELAPSFLFLENVPAIRTRGAERVGKELASRGYDCRWTCLSAAEVGAPHKRDRWWMLAAHSDRLQLRGEPGRSDRTQGEGLTFPRLDGATRVVADASGDRRFERRSECSLFERGLSPVGGCSAVGVAHCTGLEVRQGVGHNNGAKLATPFRTDWWSTEPHVGRVANGVSRRVDRLRGLGNAWVPAQARQAFEELMGIR